MQLQNEINVRQMLIKILTPPNHQQVHLLTEETQYGAPGSTLKAEDSAFQVPEAWAVIKGTSKIPANNFSPLCGITFTILYQWTIE